MKYSPIVKYKTPRSKNKYLIQFGDPFYCDSGFSTKDDIALYVRKAMSKELFYDFLKDQGAPVFITPIEDRYLIIRYRDLIVYFVKFSLIRDIDKALEKRCSPEGKPYDWLLKKYDKFDLIYRKYIIRNSAIIFLFSDQGNKFLDNLRRIKSEIDRYHKITLQN